MDKPAFMRISRAWLKASLWDTEMSIASGWDGQHHGRQLYSAFDGG